MKVEIIMHGRPVPWARARRGKGKGRYFTPPKQGKHRSDMALLLIESALATGAKPFVGPVAVAALFAYGKNPYTWVRATSSNEIDWRTYVLCPGSKLEHFQMTSRPDLDNLIKQVLEALQDSRLVKDDSQVVVIHAAKLRHG